jgi:hypothetical protein
MSVFPAPCGFLHIPKTAGMSVRAALCEAYPSDCVGSFRYDERLFGAFDRFDTFAPWLRAETLLPSDPAPETDGQLLQFGHLSLQGMTRLMPADRTFTVLREPRARVLSHHLYWSLRADEINDAFGEYQVQRHAAAGLRGFLEEPRAAHQHDNLICRMLVHDPALIPADGPIAVANHGEVARAAFAALGRLGLVTFVEDESMWQRLSDFVGAPMTAVRVNETTSTGRPSFAGPQLDSDTLALLDERTAADRLVYCEIVRRHFGMDTDEAHGFASRSLVQQAERYARTLAAAERQDIPGAAPEHERRGIFRRSRP